MSQADMEKAYTEAVDQLARAVDANRLLTERLEAQELLLAQIRKACAAATPYSDFACSAIAILDGHKRPDYAQQPPARPGEPT